MEDPNQFGLQRRGMELYFEQNEIAFSQLQDPTFRNDGIAIVQDVMECPPDEAAAIFETFTGAKPASSRSHFAPAKYRLLNFIEPDPEPAPFMEPNRDGWLRRDGSERSIWDDFTEELDIDRDVIKRKLSELSKMGFVEFHKLEGPARAKVNNIRLTDAGYAELATLRSVFADKIAAMHMRDTVRLMAAEANLMRGLLDEPPMAVPDPEKLQNGEIPEAINELEIMMGGLEARVAARDLLIAA
jgi:DNA-binding MarR family transcriptional regulator